MILPICLSHGRTVWKQQLLGKKLNLLLVLLLPSDKILYRPAGTH